MADASGTAATSVIMNTVPALAEELLGSRPGDVYRAAVAIIERPLLAHVLAAAARLEPQHAAQALSRARPRLAALTGSGRRLSPEAHRLPRRLGASLVNARRTRYHRHVFVSPMGRLSRWLGAGVLCSRGVGTGLIPSMAASAPYEDLKLKGK